MLITSETNSSIFAWMHDLAKVTCIWDILQWVFCCCSCCCSLCSITLNLIGDLQFAPGPPPAWFGSLWPVADSARAAKTHKHMCRAASSSSGCIKQPLMFLPCANRVGCIHSESKTVWVSQTNNFLARNHQWCWWRWPPPWLQTTPGRGGPSGRGKWTKSH